MKKRIVAFADSHGCKAALECAIFQAMRHGHIDIAVFLGDGISDFEELNSSLISCGTECYAVAGNNDWYSGSPTEFVFEANGLRFLALHGHTRGAKFGLDRLCYAAAEKNAGAVLYGHTHRADACVYAGVYMINPGAVCDSRRGSPAYADLIVEENGLLKPRLVDWEQE